MVFPGGAVMKNSLANESDSRDIGSISGLGRWDPMPGFLPGKLHGQRSLVGPSPWGHKELGATEYTHTHTHTHIHTYIYTHILTHIHTDTQTHIHPHTYTHTHTHTYTHTHTHTHINMDTYPHTHT